MKNQLSKIGNAVILAAILFIFSGCASIVSNSSYPLSISTDPSGAKVTVFNNEGAEVYAGTTPVNFQLNAGAGFFTKARYTLKIELEGYETRTLPVNTELDGWYLGNILFGGLLGMLIVDPATGAMWKLETNYIQEFMQKSQTSMNEPSVSIYDINEIPESWKSKLIKVE